VTIFGGLQRIIFLQFKKKEGICDRIFFFKNDFDKMAKIIRPQKKSLVDTLRVSEKRPETLYWCFR